MTPEEQATLAALRLIVQILLDAAEPEVREVVRERLSNLPTWGNPTYEADRRTEAEGYRIL